MFAGTIRENIRYGRPDATDAEIEEAARRAEIHAEILRMPDGYDSYIGERGVMLSGGQKQRVAIARVFLKNPKILILDEATSALDTVTEQRIQASLDELSRGRSSVIIAHRLSTVRNADKIAVVEDGRIVATSGMSLAEKPPYFSNPSGRIGLLSGMYTLPEYRRRGIGRRLLGRVVDEARAWGCGAVQITASDMGVLLYADFGFRKNGNFMQLKL